MQERYRSIDGLRGMAAYNVAISHFSNSTNILGGALGHGAGQLGVMLFFAISGFLMGRLYLTEPFTLAGVLVFWRRRAARVLPLFAIVVAASYVAFAAFGSASPLYPISIENLGQHILFTAGISVLWTIPVEVQFYALFPLAWAAFSRLGRSVTVWLCLLAGAAFLLNWDTPVLTSYLPWFLAGMIVSMLPPLARTTNAAFAVCAIATVAVYPRFIGLEERMWGYPHNLLLTATLLWSTASSPLADRLLGGPIMRWLGNHSYSAYLLHMPVLNLLGAVPGLSENRYAFMVVFLAATATVSTLSYHLIERPLRHLFNGNSTPLRATLLSTERDVTNASAMPPGKAPASSNTSAPDDRSHD